jgi:type III restriction enzyme
VEFDNEELIRKYVEAIRSAPLIPRARQQWHRAALSIGNAGLGATETAVSAAVNLDEGEIDLPNLLTVLQDQTQLTRRSICRILTESGRLDDFTRNPQQFIELAAEAIRQSKRLAIVDGIKYQRLGDETFYAQEQFQSEELRGYCKNMLPVQKAVCEYVVYDFEVERTFAEQLEKNEAIKVYAKPPGWFKISTPLGSYNPDWAVLVEADGTERLYFVVETKAGLFDHDLRDAESARIKCGKAHFEALRVGEAPAQYMVARNVDDLLTHC